MRMSELDMNLEVIRRVMDDEPQPQEIGAAIAVRDLMSATLSLSEMASSKTMASQVMLEANDIELAYTRLGRLLSHVRKEQSCAA